MKSKLGNIFQICSGGTPSKTHPEYYGGNIPWIKTGDLKGKDIKTASDYITDEGLKNSSAKIYPQNTVLLAMYGATIGATGILKFRACSNQACAAFIPNNEIIPEYLYYFFLSKQGIFKQAGIGGAQPNISISYLKNVEITVLPKYEQLKCVNILNKVQSILNFRKNQLRIVDSLTKALFVEMFGDPMLNSKKWLKLPFHEVIKYANNGMSRRGNDKNGSIVLRLTELQKGYIDYANPNKILLTDNEKEKYILFNNDLLFARVNGNPMNVGRCAEFSIIDEPVYYNDHIIRVRVDTKKLNSCFANILFNSKYGKKELSNKIKTSAGQYTISQDGIGSVQIILPPIKLQEKFAESIKQIDKHKSVVQKSLDETQLLFDSLMQKYFG